MGATSEKDLGPIGPGAPGAEGVVAASRDDPSCEALLLDNQL